MAETVKKGDFVELEYTGRVKDSEIVFDSTSADVAKKAGFFSDKMNYGPLIICVGYNQILKGLDDSLEDIEVGIETDIKIPTERAFGKKTTENIKLVPISAFKKNNIRPEPGLQINFGEMVGAVKRVNSGRVLVDFNHPLAGKDVSYKVIVNRIVVDTVEKVKSFVGLSLNIDSEKVDVTIKDGKPTINLPAKKFPQELLNILGTKIIEAIPELKKTEWI